MSRELAIPATGELLDLESAATDSLAQRIDEIRELRGALADAERAISDEVLARMDRRAQWTARVGDYELQARTPSSEVDYDLGRLREELDGLVAQGLLEPEAATAAFREKRETHPAKTVLRQLLRAGGEVAERVESCQIPISRPRRVKVTRRPKALRANRPQEETA